MTGEATDAGIWRDAMLSAAVFAVDPVGTGGVALRARPGPTTDFWLASLRDLLPASAPMRRMPSNISDGRLLGGLDLAATLQYGRPIAERGLLAELDGGVALLTMAERTSAGVTSHLSAAIDAGEILLERDGLGMRLPARFGLVALDEGIEDERPPAALLDRLAFHLDLDGVHQPADRSRGFVRSAVEAARGILQNVKTSDAAIEAICTAATALGIETTRAPLLALKTAHVLAALDQRYEIGPEDAAVAARLVLSARAVTLPPAMPDTPPDVPQEAAEPEGGEQEQDSLETRDQPVGDLVLAAAMAAIPPDLLERLRASGSDRQRSKAAGRAGASKSSTTRGRPIGVRKAELRSGARLNVIETLRAAAPWQSLRRRAGSTRRVEIRRDDFRVQRLKQRAETTTIFVVDASGSSALNRLAEAKGAIQLLLAECYVRRDRVALIAFRGKQAELLLPPTRSLVRAKRSLGSLPGGGGTPLASAIDAAGSLADQVRREGRTPVIVLMTDGRANVRSDGTGGRRPAEADAMMAARSLRAAGLTALLIDTSPNPQTLAEQLAREMGATYLPLPAADPGRLSRAVQSATRPAP